MNGSSIECLRTAFPAACAADKADPPDLTRLGVFGEGVDADAEKDADPGSGLPEDLRSRW